MYPVSLSELSLQDNTTVSVVNEETDKLVGAYGGVVSVVTDTTLD